MGNIILNFNISTSAFFRPILVNEFLTDTNTFGSIEKALAWLKKLQVYIEHDRHYDDEKKDIRLNKDSKRLWQFSGLSEGPIGDIVFQNAKRDEDGKPMKDDYNEYIREGPEVKVIDHLRSGKRPSPRDRLCPPDHADSIL